MSGTQRLVLGQLCGAGCSCDFNSETGTFKIMTFATWSMALEEHIHFSLKGKRKLCIII